MPFQLLTNAEAVVRGIAAGATDERWLSMAGIDPVDFRMLELASGGIGTVSGGAVTAAGGGTPMAVNVAASRVTLPQGTGLATVDYGAATLTVPTAHATKDRWYLVDNGGTFGVPRLIGPGLPSGNATAEADPLNDSPANPGPVFPGVSTNVYAAIFVPAGTTTLTNNHILDKRLSSIDRARVPAVLDHGTTPNPARPSGVKVCIFFGGSVAPTTMTTYDIWLPA